MSLTLHWVRLTEVGINTYLFFDAYEYCRKSIKEFPPFQQRLEDYIACVRHKPLPSVARVVTGKHGNTN